MNNQDKSVDSEDLNLSDDPVSIEAEGAHSDAPTSVDDTQSENNSDVNDGSSDDQTPTIESLQAAVEAMEQKADDHWQRYLRTAAEMENVRKRAQRDVENAHKFGLEKLASDVLNVRDTMAMGLEAAKEQATVESLQEGAEMTLKLLDQAMQRHGVIEINPLGDEFNPEFHEALAMIDAPDATPGTVVTVAQVGYELNGRLLRAAKVMVAKESE